MAVSRNELEYWNNWNNWNALLFYEASQVLWCLFLQGPPGECSPLWGPFCDGPSPRWPQPFARSFDRRVFPSPCVSFHPHHPLSHFISPNRIQSHRIARQGWQKDLTLQHEHDSWAGPPPDRPRQTSASPAESMSPRSLTYWHTKGGLNLWQARRPPQPQREKRNPLRPLAKEVEHLSSLLVADGLLHFSVIERSKTCILAW